MLVMETEGAKIKPSGQTLNQPMRERFKIIYELKWFQDNRLQLMQSHTAKIYALKGHDGGF